MIDKHVYIEGWRDWPKESFGGWAPGNYEYSIICRKCNGSYVGSKYSYHCYPCALKQYEEDIQKNLGSGI